MNPMHTFTEVFPVNILALPRLFAYRLVTGNKETSSIGWKFSYRLKTEFGGHWVWSENRIIGDKLTSDVDLKNIVEFLWQEQPEVFRNLQEIKQDLAFGVTPQVQADFVAFGLFSDIDRAIKLMLSDKSHEISRVKIERTYGVKPWVVNNEPSVSISVQSDLIYKQDL